jgi:hypothetical protein
MAKRYLVQNSHFMKAIKDVNFFFQEESMKIKDSQSLPLQTNIRRIVCWAKSKH